MKKLSPVVCPESEKKYRSLFENSRDALMTAEPPSGKFTSGNPAALKMFGAKNQEEFVSHGPRDLSPERQPDGRNSAEKAKEMIEMAMREGSHSFEWTHTRINGEVFPADVHLTRMELDGKTIILATVRDITERKRAQAAVEESEKKYRLLIEQSIDGIIVADRRWNIQFVNPAICRMLGYTSEELCRLNIADTSIPEERDQVARERQALRAGSIVRYERNIRKKDGSCFPVEVIIGDLGDGRHQEIVRDITDQKKAEWELRELHRRQRVLLDNIPDIAWVKDREGRYVAVNEALGKAYGHRPEEIIGKTDFDVVPVELAESYRADDNRVMESRQSKRIEEPFVNTAGQRTEIETIKSPIINDAGEVIGTAGIARDITERKRTEERLRLQSAALEAAANGIVITDSQGVILWVNPAFSSLTGYSTEEVIGTNPRVLKSGKHNGGFYHELWETITAGRVWHGEVTNRRKNGSLYIEDMTITPVRNEHGEIANFVAIKQDITERRRAESALRVRDRAFDTSVSALSTADLAGNVTYVNAAFVKMFGLASAAEILGKPFVPLFVDPAAVESSVRTLQEQGHWMGELKARRTDGAAVDIFVSASIATDDTGEPLCLVASLFDITERRHVEEALRVSSAYTRSLIEASLDPLVTIGPEGKITDVNAATETATGRKRTELIGTDFSGYFTDPENAKAGYQQVFREGSVRDYPLELRHRDGGVISVLYNATVYCDADGKVVGVFAAARDITERERAEASLRETNRRLENALADLKNAEQQVIQQERLSALGTMASGIAHDFNNSLTAILGGSELLLSRPEYLDDKEKARSYIEMMATAAQDAGKIVNRLREFYRHREDSEVLAPVNINDLVSEVVALTQPKWKAEAEVRSVSVNVHTELQEVPQIAGNAANLREMLTNLIFNAVDAMPRGGTITIRTRRDKDHVVLDVIDTGTGMTDEVRRRCLEPFFTTKGQRGTGLGLSMVYGILQRHQSTLEIETEVGKGTTFVIRLPVQTAQLQFAPITQPLNVTQPLHVLVVDDETVVRKIVGEYLKMDGHIVEAANSGDDGLEKFRNSRFDLVLVDRAMPGMSGDQVAATIKDANPAVPVIMLTGFGAMMEAADEKPTGVDFIVGKPVTIKALRAAVSKAVASVN